MENQNQQNNIFTNGEIQNIVGFCNALKKVHNRLIREGYTIKEGKIIPPPEKASS
ncbi:MAG: hypothetical protein ACOX0C_02120 [Patescibacteria group bacterium]|jgi:hypothetical protein